MLGMGPQCQNKMHFCFTLTLCPKVILWIIFKRELHGVEFPLVGSCGLLQSLELWSSLCNERANEDHLLEILIKPWERQSSERDRSLWALPSVMVSFWSCWATCPHEQLPAGSP